MNRIAFVAVILVSVSSCAWAGDIEIVITSPKDGDKVLHQPLVEGTVSDTSATVWIIVHPLEVSDYWVQPPVSVRKNGSWKVMIYIGRPGSIDADKAFEIRAIANPASTLREGKVISNWPKADAISDLIEVTRR